MTTTRKTSQGKLNLKFYLFIISSNFDRRLIVNPRQFSAELLGVRRSQNLKSWMDDHDTKYPEAKIIKLEEDIF